MSRSLRLEFAGALYQMTSQCNGRNLIYFQTYASEFFLQNTRLDLGPDKFAWCELAQL
jgi:hypothetical protein